jgi:hypothetical protein
MCIYNHTCSGKRIMKIEFNPLPGHAHLLRETRADTGYTPPKQARLGQERAEPNMPMDSSPHRTHHCMTAATRLTQRLLPSPTTPLLMQSRLGFFRVRCPGDSCDSPRSRFSAAAFARDGPGLASVFDFLSPAAALPHKQQPLLLNLKQPPLLPCSVGESAASPTAPTAAAAALAAALFGALPAAAAEGLDAEPAAQPHMPSGKD